MRKKFILEKLQYKTHRFQARFAAYIKKHRTIKILHLFRQYSSLAIVVSSAVLVIATNFSNNNSGLLFGYLGKDKPHENYFHKSLREKSRSDLAFIAMAKGNDAIDPDAKDNDSFSLMQGENMISSLDAPLVEPEEDGGVKIYEVQTGESLGSIASKFKITINTILWANDIENADSIMPGDKIFILPVAGLAHTVKNDEKIEDIAKKYSADKDKIIAYNDLKADGSLDDGQEIIIPDGKKEVPVPVVNNSSVLDRRQYASSTGGTPEVSGWRSPQGKAGTGHKFPYGYCTWYVAQKRYVPWGGNAGTWLYHAKSAGYKTGKSPTVGSIVVTSESHWGHVAVVESVSGNSFTVSEMNYKGWAKTSKRTISKNDRVIKGFIYY